MRSIRSISLFLSVTFILNNPRNKCFAYFKPSPFVRSVSVANTDNTNTGKTSSSSSLFWKKTQQPNDKFPNRTFKTIKSVIQPLVEGAAQQGPRIIHHAIYWLTAIDAIQSVRFNEYRVGMKAFYFRNAPFTRTNKEHIFVPSVYSKLFYFARLRPRLLYSCGALLRAVQLCTPFQTVLDPTAGVGAGVNLFAMFAGSRWVQPFVLGWATTKWVWVWLGARKVQGAHLPIKVSISSDKR